MRRQFERAPLLVAYDERGHAIPGRLDSTVGVWSPNQESARLWSHNQTDLLMRKNIVATSRRAATPDPRPIPQRLLGAALDLVRSEGPQGLTQARVAAAAGVRQSHLTYYFPTRQHLLKALVQVIHAERIAALSAVMPGALQTPLRTHKVREFFEQRMREPLLARLMLAITNAAEEDPSLRHWLADLDDDVLDGLREVFALLRVRPSESELALFHASLVGAAILGAQIGTRAAADRAAQIARLAFDRLLRAAPPLADQTRPTRGGRKLAR